MRYWAIKFTVPNFDAFIKSRFTPRSILATFTYKNKVFRRRIRLMTEISRQRVPWLITIRFLKNGLVVPAYIMLHETDKIMGEGCVLLTNPNCWELFGNISKLLDARR